MPKPVDLRSARTFCHYLVGWQSIGVAGEEEIIKPICPETLAHLTAALGDAVSPLYPFSAKPGSKDFAALAGYLRGVADLIDPPPS